MGAPGKTTACGMQVSEYPFIPFAYFSKRTNQQISMEC
jgi:hypothetical protein